MDPIKILHIDDNEMTRYAVSKMLQNAGFQVVTAATGKQGLDAIVQERPALVLLDVNLPDMSGYEVCRRAKTFPECEATPILHMSASFVKVEDQVRGLQGADGYLVEPIEPEVLIATVKTALRVRAAERERAVAQRAAEEAQAKLKVLADVGHLLSASLAADSALDQIVHLLVPKFADGAAIVLFEENGDARSAASTHVDSERSLLLKQILKQYPPDTRFNAARGVTYENVRVIAPVPDSFLMSIARDGEHFRMLKSLRLNSIISSGMTARGNLLGAIALLGATPERQLSAKEAEFLEDLSHRMAVVIDNHRLLRQAQHHNRMKDEFLASLAHELRNPLAPIRNAAQIMASSLDKPELLDHLRKMISKQVHHISRIIDDLTDVARIEHGKLMLRRSVVDLVALVRDAAETCQDLITRKNQSLRLDLPEAPVCVDGDATRLEQIVSNIIQNAAKYTPELGSITVEMTLHSGNVLVKVRDNGIGIPPHLLPRIFDLFTQAPQSLDRPQGGLGIGLTIVRHLVTMHGGSISARSEGEGKGSEFTIRFPVAQAPAQEQSPSSAALEQVTSKRVLVIDDNTDVRDTMAALLKAWKHEVKHVESGEAGLALMRTWKPDVVVLDIGLPNVNGFDVAKKIRSVPEWKDIYLIAATGYDSAQDKQHAMDSGFDVLLVKPVDLDQLQTLLSRQPANR